MKIFSQISLPSNTAQGLVLPTGTSPNFDDQPKLRRRQSSTIPHLITTAPASPQSAGGPHSPQQARDLTALLQTVQDSALAKLQRADDGRSVWRPDTRLRWRHWPPPQLQSQQHRKNVRRLQTNDCFKPLIASFWGRSDNPSDSGSKCFKTPSALPDFPKMTQCEKPA